MANYPALPAEGAYTDAEHNWIDNEPPGLLPGDQSSYWGQMRKVFTDQIQTVIDLFTEFYTDLDPSTVDADDIGNWEAELAIPSDTTKSLATRQAFVITHLAKGAFTRTRRVQIVEAFIMATFGQTMEFTLAGIPFDAGGIPFFGDITSLAGTYRIVEDIPSFSYDVRILDTITVDGLDRELAHFTPAGISFTISYVAVP